MRGFVVSTIVTAITFWIVTTFLPQFIAFEGEPIGLIVLAVIFGVVNGLIGPIVRLLALPVRMMTLGLIGFVINGGLLLLTAAIADAVGYSFTVGDFPPTLLSADTIIGAIVGAVALSLVGTGVRLVVPD